MGLQEAPVEGGTVRDWCLSLPFPVVSLVGILSSVSLFLQVGWNRVLVSPAT